MVGLSDIPCVGVALNKISEATVEAAYHGLRYMFCYKSLVVVLNSEIETFNIQESRVSQKVVEENNNGKILEDHVTKWQKNGVEIHESFKDFTERYKKRTSWRCIPCVPIPNPLSRFRLGREAVQKTNRVAELTVSGKELLKNPIAHLPPVENRPKTDGEFLNFPSRQHAYEKIWQSLVTEGSPCILGIYGVPGAGKTRLAKQIWEEVKQKGIFDKVTRAVLSNEKLDVIKLQKDLAGHLNCRFESQDDVDGRASQLKQSLMNGGKILIILDDVWRKIPLDVIGIQFGADTSSKGSKILFTSREENVCLSNNCTDPVKITALEVDEAWDMFKDSVGTGKIESLQDEFLAKQVCNKCAGLPLIIWAVGKTLKFMSQHLWEDALKQLENCNIQSVPGIDPEVYACLKLSFDNLVDNDAKLCLLLCSLYPEDTYININNLILIAKGSQLVDGSRVYAMVDILKSSSLLLEDLFDDKAFKLHDIIRDVARSIAVNDYAFLFARSDMQLPHNYNRTPKLLCLDVNDITFYSPEDMVCDGIYTLRIESTFFRKFRVWEVASMCVNLRFLNLIYIKWEQQIHVQQLGKLRTLVLEECDIRKTDFSFISENLETLSLSRCDLPEPLNIINLKYLRKLEIIGEPVFLVANTISCLSSLEELHLISGYRYQRYGEEINDDEFTRIQLNDISKLTRLKSLKMQFAAGASLQHIQHPKLFSTLREFDIYVGTGGTESTYGFLKKSIKIFGNKLEAFQSLIERAQLVILLSTDVDVSSIFNSNTEAFADLEHLKIDDSETMKQLARMSLHHHQIQPRTSFFKLTNLSIESCYAMKYLFSNSVAKCLLQLESLYVHNCDVMETIIMNDDSTIDGQDIIINFSKLKLLNLSLPRLKSFYLENKDIHSTSLFCGKVAFPALEVLTLEYSGDEISDIWGKHYYNDNASSFSKLETLDVQGCRKLETVIPLAMSHKLQNLESLYISDCRSLISVVGTYVNNTAVCPLVALTDMHLENLPCLTNTWLNSTDHSHATNLYPNLRKLYIGECHSLSVDHSQATNLYPNLEVLFMEGVSTIKHH